VIKGVDWKGFVTRRILRDGERNLHYADLFNDTHSLKFPRALRKMPETGSTTDEDDADSKAFDLDMMGKELELDL